MNKSPLEETNNNSLSYNNKWGVKIDGRNIYISKGKQNTEATILQKLTWRKHKEGRTTTWKSFKPYNRYTGDQSKDEGSGDGVRVGDGGGGVYGGWSRGWWWGRGGGGGDCYDDDDEDDDDDDKFAAYVK